MSQYGYRRKDGMYGLDADLKRKNDAKYKQDDEDEARAWLSALLEVSLEGDFYEVLKDGMVLCQAINRISPGLIRKINKQKVPFMQMENIGNYLDACRALGMADTLIFLTVDLYEKKNMYQVLQNILALANLCGSVEGYSGPVLDLPDANGGGFDGGAPFEPEDVPAAVAVVAEAVTAPEPEPVSPPEPEPVSPPEPEPVSPPDNADEPAQAVPEPIVVEAQVADEDVPEFSDKATALVTLLESLGAPEVKNAFMAAEALNPGKINEIVEAILQEFSE